jgi:hypothetical protein
MMRSPSFNEVRKLIAHLDAPCLSMYMPIRGDASTEDQTRWASLLSRARKSLSSARPLDIEAFLAPLHSPSLPDSPRRSALGVAAFRSASVSAQYVVPARFEATVVVSNRFHVSPLLQSVRANERYFLLELSQGRVAFFEGDAGGLTPHFLPQLPASLAAAVGSEHAERVIGVCGGGSGPVVWHGQGKDERSQQEDELKFVRAIERSLSETLRDEIAPLVVAGSGKLLPLFQRRCRYAHLLPDVVHGSLGNAPLEELRAKAWPIVQAHVAHRELQLVERFRESVSDDRATDELTSMARFAVQGRVRDLMVARDAHVWGRMDTTSGALDVRSGSPRAEDENILDGLVEAVFLRGGDVHELAPDRMPGGASAAATLRW